MTTLYVQVLLPLALRQEYTYRVPLELNEFVDIGKRVIVQFGKRKIYTGLVIEVSEVGPTQYQAKYILNVLDDIPVVTDKQIQFWKWMASYYLCSLGEVMNAALPSAMKLESESEVELLVNMDYDPEDLDPRELLIMQYLEQEGKIKIDNIEAHTGVKNGYKYVHSLYERGLVTITEEVHERYKPKLNTYILLSSSYQDESAQQELFERLEKKAPLQLNVVMRLLMEDKLFEGVEKSEFVKQFNLSPSSVKTLVKNEILKEEKREVDRVVYRGNSEFPNHELTEDQLVAMTEIEEGFSQNKPVLLHGITSSGKTHLYIDLIEKTLMEGKQVLYLLPEISLTTQLIRRIQTYFGEKVLISHSRFNDQERQEIWNKVKQGLGKVLMAPRSGVFMPFDDLGLVIVDEEHETSYKQMEPAPRYHARDTAVVLAKIYQANIILGSATPSVESSYNADHGKYRRVMLTNRYSGVELPNFMLVDMAMERKQKTIKGLFSSVLLDEVGKVLKEGNQAILFQNRKGYVPITECPDCSWSPRCIHCDITLTYYRYEDRLRCHFCGYSTPPVSECAACGNNALSMSGYGTERIETELQNFFPDARIDRMDQDSTRKKQALENIITRFEKRETDVLIGTQMITKGLDFDHLRLVGILDADHSLNFPDFRAYERSFQLFTQVAGRAGRREEAGTVIIQTNQPQHPVLDTVVSHDYLRYYQTDLMERQKFNYPPYCRLIRITLKHRDQDTVDQAANYLGDLMRQKLGEHLLGPQRPHVARIRNRYLQQLMIKINSPLPLAGTKTFVDECIRTTYGQKAFNRLRINCDVDPV